MQFNPIACISRINEQMQVLPTLAHGLIDSRFYQFLNLNNSQIPVTASNYGSTVMSNLMKLHTCFVGKLEDNLQMLLPYSRLRISCVRAPMKGFAKSFQVFVLFLFSQFTLSMS